MALTRPLQIFDAVPQRARPISRNNVIPFRAPRVLLPVTLPGRTEAASRELLRTLLYSPLGVYVVRTEIVRGNVLVHFDIAPDDLDCTMHTLIATLPEAIIGQLRRRGASAEVR
jgi:hypothetical protein